MINHVRTIFFFNSLDGQVRRLGRSPAFYTS